MALLLLLYGNIFIEDNIAALLDQEQYI